MAVISRLAWRTFFVAWQPFIFTEARECSKETRSVEVSTSAWRTIVWSSKALVPSIGWLCLGGVKYPTQEVNVYTVRATTF